MSNPEKLVAPTGTAPVWLAYETSRILYPPGALSFPTSKPRNRIVIKQVQIAKGKGWKRLTRFQPSF